MNRVKQAFQLSSSRDQPNCLLRDVRGLSCSAVPDSLWTHRLQPSRRLCPLDFTGKNTGTGCHFLLEGIFLTQGSNPRLLHQQAGSLPLSHQGSPYLEMPENTCALLVLCASLAALVVKNLPADAGDIRDEGSISGLGRSPGPSTPVFFLGESHGQRSLVGYSPRGAQSQTWLSSMQAVVLWGCVALCFAILLWQYLTDTYTKKWIHLVKM